MEPAYWWAPTAPDETQASEIAAMGYQIVRCEETMALQNQHIPEPMVNLLQWSEKDDVVVFFGIFTPPELETLLLSDLFTDVYMPWLGRMHKVAGAQW